MMEIKQRVLTDAEFQRIHQIELELLKEFDRICRKHDIKYVMWGGTMLGAIRHHGFIPWDDDADIAMTREEYQKLKNVIHELNPEICFFQDNTTDLYYRWGYGKLRKTGTRYVRLGQEHLRAQDGVFVDIFPYDDIPQLLPLQMLQDFYCFLIRKITWSEVGKKQTKGILRLWYTILAKIPVNIVFKMLDWIHRNSSNTSPNKVTCLMFTAIGKLYYKQPLNNRYGIPKKWLLEREEFDFENLRLFGSKHYHEYLTYVFRDYMKLPNENKRIQHSPVSFIKL